MELQLQRRPSNEYLGLISFRMDCFDLLAIHGTLKSLLQHHSSKASILGHSAFFTVQLSHPYIANGKELTKKIILSLTRFINSLVIKLSSLLPGHVGKLSQEIYLLLGKKGKRKQRHSE